MTDLGMAAWEAACAVGPQHESLKKFAGSWKKEMITRWGGNETRVYGQIRAEMILDGKYLRSVEEGVMRGKPYFGEGIIGYDNYKSKFMLFWVDNIGTSASYSYGTASADYKCYTFHGTIDEPMTGERDKPIRLVYEFETNDRLVFKIFVNIGKPEESNPLEIVYTRE
jgi:hypothetical protein